MRSAHQSIRRDSVELLHEVRLSGTASDPFESKVVGWVTLARVKLPLILGRVAGYRVLVDRRGNREPVQCERIGGVASGCRPARRRS
jgi:hypothetical protein